MGQVTPGLHLPVTMAPDRAPSPGLSVPRLLFHSSPLKRGAPGPSSVFLEARPRNPWSSTAASGRRGVILGLIPPLRPPSSRSPLAPQSLPAAVPELLAVAAERSKTPVQSQGTLASTESGAAFRLPTWESRANAHAHLHGQRRETMSTPEVDERKWLLFPRPKQSTSSCVPGRGASGGSYVTCPTCQGRGRIPQELEKQLVALIPFGDQRLKPRRTKLFVSLAVLMCLVTTSLIIFFLLPRGITVHPAGLNSSTVAFDKADVLLNATGILNISNPNYWPITVSQLTVQVLHLSLVVGQLSKSLLLHIGPLTSEQMFYTVASRIEDENTYKICTWLEIKVHHVVLHIQGTVTCSYLGHVEERIFESFEYADCRAPHQLVLETRSAMAPT